MNGQSFVEGFDLHAFRREIRRSTIVATRGSELAVGASFLDALGGRAEPFELFHHGDLELLASNIRRSLAHEVSRHDLRLLLARVYFLIDFFSGLTGDPAPSIHLAFPTSDAECEAYVLRQGAVRSECSLATTLCGAEPENRSVLVSRGSAGRTLALKRCAGAGKLMLHVSTRRTPYFLLNRPAAVATDTTGIDVLLVSMPFGPLAVPSLALGLLKSGLVESDLVKSGPVKSGSGSDLKSGTIRSKVLYLNLAFADQIGVPLYNFISYTEPAALLGEWIFSASLFGERASSPEVYFSEVLRQPDGLGDIVELEDVTEARLEDVLRARDQVEDFLDSCVEEVLSHRPRIIGFTSAFQQHVASLALAQRLKQRRPDLTIVFGGPNCEDQMGVETARQFGFLDAVVSGEADIVFPELVRRLLNDEPIADLEGIHTSSPGSRRPPNGVNTKMVREMDGLAYPDYDDFFERWRATPSFAYRTVSAIPMETSRGCWWGAKHHCTFCGLNGTSMAFRAKSPNRAFREIRHMMMRYQCKRIAMADPILDMGYFGTLLPLLAEQRVGCELYYEVKANLRKSHVATLKAGGVTAIQPGIESFSDHVLELMRKGVTGLQNIQLLKWCREFGIDVAWNLLWGFPGERTEDYADMLTLMPLLTHLQPPVGGGSMRVDRFSPSFTQSEALGFGRISPVPAYFHVYPLESDAIENLAYYFRSEYRDDDQARTFARDMVEGYLDWRECHQQSRLVYLDKGGCVFIWDLRPCAIKRLTLLTGLERELYLACDAIRSMRQLIPLLETADRKGDEQLVAARLEPLLAARLMVRRDDRVLSLAVAIRPAPAQALPTVPLMDRQMAPWPAPVAELNSDVPIQDLKT